MAYYYSKAINGPAPYYSFLKKVQVTVVISCHTSKATEHWNSHSTQLTVIEIIHHPDNINEISKWGHFYAQFPIQS